MKKNVTLCPIGLGFRIAIGLMLEAYSVANLVEKLFGFCLHRSTSAALLCYTFLGFFYLFLILGNLKILGR